MSKPIASSGVPDFVNLWKSTQNALFWAGRFIYWPALCWVLTLLGGNFLMAPIGFKPAIFPEYVSVLSWVGIAAYVVSFSAKLGLPWDYVSAVDQGMKRRKYLGAKALEAHADLIAKAKRLCGREGLASGEFGCPEPYSLWINDNSPGSKKKFEAAKRTAEAYKPVLLESLKKALGDELVTKLGDPEKYLYPKSGPGHGEVLAYCNLVFNHADKSLFDGMPLPQEQVTYSRNPQFIIPRDRNIEVSQAAGFGVFNPGVEQYMPGDLLITVGVKTEDDLTSYYSSWRYQVNPNADNFLKAMVNPNSAPRGTSSSSL